MRVSHAKPDWSKIRYKKLTFKNFGPFRGKHEIDFKLKPGVVGIFHIEGENGIGKSTIVRAFKFLLQGDKAELNLDIKKLVNNHQQKDFESDTVVDTWVSLALEVQPSVDNDQYSKEPLEVTIFRKLSGTLKNLKTDDPTLRIEQDTKDSEYTEDIMKTYFSDGIVRFLFYDGEISKDFKALLNADSLQAVGRAIKQEIVGILGIENLKTLSQDLQYVLKKINDEILLEASQERRNDVSTQKIQELNEKIRFHETEEVDAIEKLKEYKKKKTEFETYFKNHKDAKETIAQIDNHRASIAECEQDAGNSLEKIKNVFDEKTSKMLVTPWIRLQTNKIKNEKEEKEKELKKIIMRNDNLHNLEIMIDAGICNTCQSQLSPDKISNFKTMIDEMRSGIQSHEEISRILNNLTNKREMLDSIIVNENLEFMEGKMESYDAILMKIDDKKRKIKDLEDQMRGMNNEEVRLKKIEDDTNEQYIGVQMQRRERALLDKKINEEEREKTSKRLILTSQNTIEKQKLATFLYYTIEQAIGLFASEVKESVEKDANEIFLALTTEKEYKELKLDDNYALSIKLESGTEVPLPSMAQNRTLILALIAALHKNSDLSAPLVMDSAFTGFDDDHKENILKTLHKISTQVILLTFKAELPLSESKSTLGADIQGQARLKQINWGNSQIEEV